MYIVKNLFYNDLYNQKPLKTDQAILETLLSTKTFFCFSPNFYEKDTPRKNFAGTKVFQQ